MNIEELRNKHMSLLNRFEAMSKEERESEEGKKLIADIKESLKITHDLWVRAFDKLFIQHR